MNRIHLARLWHVQATTAIFREVFNTPFAIVIDVHVVNQ